MGQPLGQHFLKNSKAIAVAIQALNLRAGETVIEIGPGEGALTLPLAEACATAGARLVAIERDGELARQLVGRWSLAGEERVLEIIEGDVLQKLPELINKPTNQQANWKLIGNIPYYITGSLLRLLSELPHKPQITVLMIQKEVAQRLAAKPGQMNLLAAATQIWATPTTLMHLPPRDFSPPPKVHSTIIKLETKNVELQTEELERYYRALHILFKQPRKMLVNNLAEAVEKSRAAAFLENLGLAPNARPQDLTLAQCLQLSQLLS